MRLPALPFGLGIRKVPAKRCVELAAGLGCALGGLAGGYPRFDDSLVLRIVVALSAGVFGAGVLRIGLAARSRGEAFARSLGLSVVGGVAATIAPAAILALQKGEMSIFLLGILFGTFFGAPTGFFYGIFLAVLTAMTFRDVAAKTEEGFDGAVMKASIWLVVPAVLSSLVTLFYDMPRYDIAPYEHGSLLVSAPLSALASLAAMAAAFVAMMIAEHRLVKRRAWLASVREGHAPTYRLRALDPNDDTQDLPMLSEGRTVLEWVPQLDVSAYRDAPLGIPVALVADPPLRR